MEWRASSRSVAFSTRWRGSLARGLAKGIRREGESGDFEDFRMDIDACLPACLPAEVARKVNILTWCSSSEILVWASEMLVWFVQGSVVPHSGQMWGIAGLEFGRICVSVRVSVGIGNTRRLILYNVKCSYQRLKDAVLLLIMISCWVGFFWG